MKRSTVRWTIGAIAAAAVAMYIAVRVMAPDLVAIPDGSAEEEADVDGAILVEGVATVCTTADASTTATMRAMIRAANAASNAATLTVDYPHDGTVFPPEIIAPVFLWHEPDARADAWLIDVALENGAQHVYALTSGRLPPPGPIDPACIAETNQIYQPTPYQASAKSWTPSDDVWTAIKQGSVNLPAAVSIVGFRRGDPDTVLSRRRIEFTTSADPVGAPIFYRDVPLAPALTEKGVIKPLGDEAVALIGWRLRDIGKPESRLLLTDVPTCTNCHSFSADGTTLGMDLDGPQGDKGAYVIAAVTKHIKFRQQDIISWNSFPDKPEGHRTIGFLSQISPDGRYAVTTLNEAVFVSNFMDYRFLQVFYPTRGVLGYFERASGDIRVLPGADDPRYVHCDAVWTPDGEQLVFARAEAKDPYPANGSLPEHPNDPTETQIQYDLYRIPFDGGRGGRPEPIAGASQNGWSNTFPKVSPDGKWIVFVKCRNGQLLRPDSTLWIVPAEGGEARRMTCNTSLMNSWHSFSPNGRWMVFSSKVNTPYTQMFLTHIDQDGVDSPPVLIPNSTAANRAVNLPEFVNVAYDELVSIEVPAIEHLRRSLRGVELAKQGRFDAAIAEFDAAVELNPNFFQAHIDAAIALGKQGKFPEAMARLHQALELSPGDSRAQAHAGLVFMHSGKIEEAVEHFQTAVDLDPANRMAHLNLARIFVQRGELATATVHFQSALELDGNDPLGHLELGNTLLQRNMPAEAAAQFRRSLAIDPGSVDARLALSKACVAQGDYGSAVAQLQQAVSRDPNNIRAVADLAWLLAVCPADDVRNGRRALELAQRACAVTRFRNPVLLNTLAAAHAETGDFAAAIAVADKALQLLGPQDAALATWIRQNVDLFRAGKPCRPPAGDSPP